MRTIQIRIIAIIFCAILIASCTSNQDSQAERLFIDMYRDCEMNTLLRLSYIGGLYEGDDRVNFWLVPLSDTSVIFPAGYNIGLFSFDEEQGQWVEIKNKFQYFPADAKYIVGKNDPDKEYAQDLIGVKPISGKKADIRIIVHGHTYEGGAETDRCVGAFLDFPYTP